MKKSLLLAALIGPLLFSCSKKNTPAIKPPNVVEYTFTANNAGTYVMNYYDGISLGSAVTITASSWSQKITIPVGNKTANIFFTAGENPPFYTNNTGSVTIKVNGTVVATGSKQFTSTVTLAQASYTFIDN